MPVILWLLAHGAMVWQAGLALTLALAVMLAARRVGRRAAKEAEVLRAGLGSPLRAAAALRDGDALLVAGRLETRGGLDVHGGIAAAQLAYPVKARKIAFAWETVARARTAHLVLTVDEDGIEITGPLQIVVGSRERRRLRRVGSAASLFQGELDPGTKHAAAFAADLRTLSAGDPVWVFGSIQRAGTEGPGGYRDRGVRWRLLPAAGEATVKIAFAGTPRIRSHGAFASYAIHAAVGAALFLLGSGIAGETAHRRLVNEDAQEPATGARAIVGAAAVVAITPFHAADARRAIQKAIERRDREDGELLEVLAALYEQRGERDRVAQLWIDRGQLERGAAAAEIAGDDDLAALASYAAGDFERASRAWEKAAAAGKHRALVDARFSRPAERHRLGVQVHLLAGRLELAAEEARLLADEIWGPVFISKGLRGYDARAGRARCLADALEARRGDQAARARIERERSKESVLACSILLADLLRGSERGAMLQALGAIAPDTTDVAPSWLVLLAAEANPGAVEIPEARALSASDKIYLDPRFVLRGALPAVERALAEASVGKSPIALRTRARASAAAAAFASAAGDHAAARRFAAALNVATQALPRDELPADLDGSRAADLEAVVALAAGDVGPAEQRSRKSSGPIPPLFEIALEARRTRDPRRMAQLADLFRLTRTDRGHPLLAVDRDGLRLGAFVRDAAAQHGEGLWGDLELYRALRILAPTIDRNRGDPLRWLRWGRRTWPLQCSPICQLEIWRALADAASTLGDPALAAEFAARAKRFYRGMLRREIAVPLAVAEGL